MSDEVQLAPVVYELVASLTELDVSYEQLPTGREQLPCVSVQTLTGTPVDRRYKDGSYIGLYRFAVYIRQTTEDNASRLDGAKAMTRLAADIVASAVALSEPFVFWSIEQDTLPVKVEAHEAYDDWQATFTLRYKKGKQL
jgi:hypothetical protein